MAGGARLDSQRTYSERAYDALKKAIIAGTLRPGELLRERELAERYGLGRTPVREALHTLQQDGLVEAVPRAGYIVSAITTRDVNELFQLRLILETAAAELAAQNATREQLEQIKQSADFRYVYGESDSYAEFLTRNTEFHHGVAMASGNERLAEILLRLLEDLERLFNLELDVRDSAEEMVAEHVDLVSALLERDSQKARQIMADQIRSSEQRVLEAIVGHTGPGVTLEL